jgi:hypothetical protein
MLMRIWIRNTAFSFQIFGFPICGLGHQGNLRICGLIITNLRTCDLRTCTPKNIADLRLQNEPKNLRFAD